MHAMDHVQRIMLVCVLLWAGSTADQQQEAAAASSSALARAAKGGLVKHMNMGVGGYQIIPNFVVTHKGHKVQVKDRIGCENVCDEQEECRSFSYRAGDKRCLWSKYALHFDSKFSFHMKLTKMTDSGEMKATGKYKQFDNFGFHEPGWRKLVSDQGGCEDLCNKINRCGAYSYRAYDQTCQMSGDGVKFDTDFTYYERNMPRAHDPEEMKLLAGSDDDDEGLMDSEKASAASLKDDSVSKAAKIISDKAIVAKKVIQEASKEMLSGNLLDGEDLETKEQNMREGMKRAAGERIKKMNGVKKIETLRAQAGKIQGLQMKKLSMETEHKAHEKIKNAFQEGYEKAQSKNRAGYEDQVREISRKGTVSVQEQTSKINHVAKVLEKSQKEKEKKETTQKEEDQKALKKELKIKAVQEVRVNSLKKYAADHIAHQTLRSKNEDKLKRILVIAEKRRKREKGYKEVKIKKIHEEKKKKQEKKQQAEKERKEKIRHESNVKEEEKKHVEFARKRKEQSHKEIDKKEQVHKRNLKAQEMKRKLQQAKADANELSDKHTERQAKIGKCEENRVKGQFMTYAYARTTTFTSAMAPSQTYGAQPEYNGMLRIQNGLGNKKQHAYLKFSANGNKIVDEAVLLEVDESDSSVPSTSDNVVENAANKEIIDKSKVQYIARRRWVDRRRRWSVEPVVSDRRRDVLASRRRELSERRRRSITALETSIRKAQLKVFKFGGPAAKLEIRACNCNWERPTLNYGDASKLSVPESWRRALRSQSLVEVSEGDSVELGDHDAAQFGYWGAQQNNKILGDASDSADEEDSRRRAGPSSRPPPILPIPAPYVPDRRRYIDRRRRFPTPGETPGEVDPSAPPATARRRRFVGQTTGTVYVPEGNNMWISIPLSANIIGVMRSVDKLCFEITGGGPTQPVILGSELSTNKPYLELNVVGQAGARRRRCSQQVKLKGIS